MSTGLLRAGEFRLHSGAATDFKIDCDALTDEDLDAAAAQLARRVGRFRRAFGVPTGGDRIAAALAPYATGDTLDPLLIVDDVATTGASLMHHLGVLAATGEDVAAARAAVIFDRMPVTHPWIIALFRLTPEVDDA